MRHYLRWALFLVIGHVSLAQAITLTWNPSARADGYLLSYGLASGQYDTVLDTGPDTSAAISGLTPVTEYFFAAQAYNDFGESDYSNEVSAVIPVTPPPDTTPPVVRISSPSNGSTVPKKSQVRIQVQASDDRGVTMVKMFVDGAIVCTDLTSSYSCPWSVPAPRGRSYQLQATAFDAAGNRGLSAIVTVTSR